MERLIKTWDECGHIHNAIIACENKCQNNHAPSCYCDPMISVRKRLAAYENTGLAPEDVPRWIPISEQLPAKAGRYLVLTKMNWAHGGTWGNNGGDERNNMTVGYFGGVGFSIPHVTHWMPLPEPPREENDARI